MSRRLRRAGLAALAALAVLACSPAFRVSVARAAEGESPAAKAAWEKGRTLASQKKWDEAADAFREAFVLEANQQFKLDLARALLAAGKASEASRAIDEIEASKDASAGVREAAAKLRDKTEKQLGTIVVTVTGGGGRAVIEIDGKRAKSGEPARVDPGKHQIRAHSDGWIPMEMTLEVEAGKKESVPFKLEPDPGASAAPAEAPAGAGETAPPPEPSGDGTLLPAAIAWGIGGVGIGVGTIFGIFAFNEADKARENCVGDRCTEDARDAIHTSKINGGASTVGFIVGGAGLATGIVLAIVYGGSSDGAATASAGPVEMSPWFGGTSAGVDGSF